MNVTLCVLIEKLHSRRTTKSDAGNIQVTISTSFFHSKFPAVIVDLQLEVQYFRMNEHCRGPQHFVVLE